MIYKLFNKESAVFAYQYIVLIGLGIFIMADFAVNKQINEFLAGAWIGVMFSPGKNQEK